MVNHESREKGAFFFGIMAATCAEERFSGLCSYPLLCIVLDQEAVDERICYEG